MPVFKRWKGKKITSSHPNWNEARWTVEFRIQGKRVQQAVPTAKTKADAERAETKLRKDLYDRRYGRGGAQMGFTQFFDEHYMPWSKENKKSHRDDENRGLLLKAYFKDDALCDIESADIDEFIRSIYGKKTKRNNPRSRRVFTFFPIRYHRVYAVCCYFWSRIGQLES